METETDSSSPPRARFNVDDIVIAFMPAIRGRIRGRIREAIVAAKHCGH